VAGAIAVIIITLNLKLIADFVIGG